MRTNHRRGYVDPGSRSWMTCVSSSVKADARSNRRAIERRLLHAITRQHLDPDQVAFPHRNVEVSNVWDYD